MLEIPLLFSGFGRRGKRDRLLYGEVDGHNDDDGEGCYKKKQFLQYMENTRVSHFAFLLDTLVLMNFQLSLSLPQKHKANSGKKD